jgi:acyl-CoA dehydrogenase
LVPFLEALGAGLVLEPYNAVVLHCATTLARALPNTIAEELLAPVMTGEVLAVLLVPPPGSVQISQRPGGKVALTGDLALVPGAAAASRMFAIIGTGDEAQLLLIDPAGIERLPYRVTDDQPAAWVCLKGASADVLAAGPAVGAALDWGQDLATAGALAEMSGVIAALMRATREHVATRTQFGQVIGRFQSVQHRMADLFIGSEEARSMAILAAEAMELPQATQRARLISAAKVKLGACARGAMRDAVQLHGGMGMTDELIIGHLVKRLLVLEHQGGSSRTHLTRFSRGG